MASFFPLTVAEEQEHLRLALRLSQLDLGGSSGAFEGNSIGIAVADSGASAEGTADAGGCEPEPEWILVHDQDDRTVVSLQQVGGGAQASAQAAASSEPQSPTACPQGQVQVGEMEVAQTPPLPRASGAPPPPPRRGGQRPPTVRALVRALDSGLPVDRDVVLAAVLRWCSQEDLDWATQMGPPHYVVWNIPGSPGATGVHSGGSVAWAFLRDRIGPVGDTLPRGVHLCRRDCIFHAILTYVSEAPKHKVRMTPPFH